MKAKRDPDPTIRRSVRVLAMVHELHKRGYQRLRACPGFSPSGAYWRCAVTHAANTSPFNGALLLDYNLDTTHYSSADENRYFDWPDARTDTARELATKFVERFPGIAEKGLGRDWAYAGWYTEMLGFAERSCLPVAYADWYPGEEPEEGWLELTCGEGAPPGHRRAGLPVPPPPTRGFEEEPQA